MGIIAGGIAAGALGAAGGIGGALLSQPENRSLYREGYKSLLAQQDFAPAIAALTAAYGPYYAAAQNQQLQRSLLGGPAQDFTAQYGYTYKGRPQTGSISIPLPETTGLVDLYTQAAGRSRSAEVADLQRYGPELANLYRNLDPAQNNLLQQLYGQASRDLSMPVEDDPEVIRELQQAARAAQAARGFGYSTSDAINEAAFVGREGVLFKDAMKRQRQDFGLRTLGAGAATTPDVSAILLGRTGVAPFGAAAGAAGAAGARMPTFDPFNAYGAQVGAQNAYAQNAYNANLGNLASGAGGSLFNLAGGLIAQGYGGSPYMGAGGNPYYSQRWAGGGASLPYG